SDVNYLNGIRLLSGSFTAHSKDGHGKWFDEIVANTSGFGNDPYEAARLQVQKNRLYRFDMFWRLNDYFNPALTIADGRHFRDTSDTLQNYDLLLLPQSKVRFFFGYSRSNQDGLGLSTVLLFNSRGDIFTPFLNMRRVSNEFRVGNDIEVGG